MLMHRMRAATPVQRLTLSGVLCLTALLATAFTAAAVLSAAGADRAVTAVGWVAALWFVAIPLVFLIGQVRGRLFAGAALRRVLALLGPHASATHVERAMAAALGDPSLRVAYPAPGGRRLPRRGGARGSDPRRSGRRGLRASRQRRPGRRDRP